LGPGLASAPGLNANLPAPTGIAATLPEVGDDVGIPTKPPYERPPVPEPLFGETAFPETPDVSRIKADIRTLPDKGDFTPTASIEYKPAAHGSLQTLLDKITPNCVVILPAG
jgi:hypothetical protein